MPDKCHLQGPISCPQCGMKILDVARFQWGAVPGHTYQLGDRVHWLLRINGDLAPSFKLFCIGPGRYMWNCGEPTMGLVILLDADIYSQGHGCSCEGCSYKIGAVAAILVEEKFESVRVLSEAEVASLPGQAAGRINIFTAGTDGLLVARSEWNDVEVTYVGSLA